MMDAPVLGGRAVALVGCALASSLGAIAIPGLEPVAALLDLLVLGLVGVDLVRTPRPGWLRVRRMVDPVLAVNSPAAVTLHLEARPGRLGARFDAEVRDVTPDGFSSDGSERRSIRFSGSISVTYRVTPAQRGEWSLGDVWIRVRGPWGLVWRQNRVPAAAQVRVFPALDGSTDDLLVLARRDEASRTVRIRSEGREFDSLREYRAGDDRRLVDWKATARRGRPIVREHRPERNQHVLVLLDCGRHMAGSIDGRPKLDRAVDATVRMAAAASEQGDLFGVVAFSASLKSALWPTREPARAATVARALMSVQADLEEPDYGLALDTALFRIRRRTLIVILTDLFDADAARPLLARVALLVPRHLPVIISLADPQLHRAALQVPGTIPAAYQRLVAAGVEASITSTVVQLRSMGARVVRAPAATLGLESVAMYLDVKRRGLL